MNFLTFLGYYAAAKFIVEGVTFTAFLLYRKYRRNQLQNAIARGDIKMMSLEDMFKHMQQASAEEKKTWN